MVRKFTAVSSIALILSVPAYAQERTFVTDPPAASGSGVTYNSGTNTATATAADGARLFSTTKNIERGAKYTYEFTVSSRTAGSVQPYVGTIRDTYTGLNIAAPIPAAGNLTNSGRVAIADNFTTNSGLDASTAATDTYPDPGAFRLWCGAGQVKADDPLVIPNKPGAAHLHQFFGNTGTNAYSTYKSLRSSGGSTCGSSQAFPVWRTSYWFPANLNGRGGVVTPASINVYYKRYGLAKPECTEGNAARIGICVNMPHGLAMIWGYNMATMAADTANVTWFCRTRQGGGGSGDQLAAPTGPSTGNIGFPTLQALRNAGTCPMGAVIDVGTNAPQCWDGVNIDSPNHRTHVSYLVANKCPNTHPYHIPAINLQIDFDVDANLNTWRLSSDDQMGMGVVAGETFHTDIIIAPSPQHFNIAEANCLDLNLSCSNGQDGVSKQITGNNALALGRSRVFPMQRLGFGRLRSTNGTFKGEFTALADGEFGLAFLGATLNVTGFKVTKITKGRRGPVTIGTTQ